jgi:predicted nucleotidyltransferase
MFGLKSNHINAIKDCFINFEQISKVIIYGSRAKGNFRNGSDIDLTIIGDMNFKNLLALENQLDDLMLPYKIDLSLLHQIDNHNLLDHIKRVGISFYEKKI